MSEDHDNRRTDRQQMTDDYASRESLEVRGDSGISVKDIKDQPRWIRWSLYIIILAILLVGTYVIGRAVPWTPMEIEDVSIDPSTSCGGEEIEVTYTGELEGGLYTIDRIDGFAYWLSGEDPRPYSSIYFNLHELEPFERMEFPGPTRRIAPWPQDDWHAGVDATVYGKRLGFISVQQSVHIESEDVLTTYDRFADECNGA